MRGIEIYHVKGNGWNDIGYNFLVDKYGQVFEGRYGGVDKTVIGAHAEGFNTGSVGVAVIGDYSARRLRAAAQARSCSCSPGGSTSRTSIRSRRSTWISGGNARFPSRRAGLPARDLRPSRHGLHRLPGRRALRAAAAIAKDVAALGGPKIYAPDVARQARRGPGALHGAAVRRAPWTVTVADSRGSGRAGTGSGASGRLDVGLARRAARRVLVDDRRRRTIGTGALGAGAALALQKAAPRRASSRRGDTTMMSYTLTAAGDRHRDARRPAAQALATLLVAPKPAGTQTLLHAAAGPAERPGTRRVAATAGRRTVDGGVPFAVDDLLGGAHGDRTPRASPPAPAARLALQVMSRHELVLRRVSLSSRAADVRWDGARRRHAARRAYASAHDTALFGDVHAHCDVDGRHDDAGVTVLSDPHSLQRLGEAVTSAHGRRPRVTRASLKKQARALFWLKQEARR